MGSFLRNWQTSVAGIIAGLNMLLQQYNAFMDDDPNTHVEKTVIFAAVSLIWLGLSSRQVNTSDEQSGAGIKPPHNDWPNKK